MKLGTLRLGIVGTNLKIRGNLDLWQLGRGGGGGRGGVFNLATIQSIKTIIAKMKQN